MRTVATYDPDADRPVTPQAFGGRRLAVDRDRIREAIRKLELMDRQAAAEALPLVTALVFCEATKDTRTGVDLEKVLHRFQAPAGVSLEHVKLEVQAYMILLARGYVGALVLEFVHCRPDGRESHIGTLELEFPPLQPQCTTRFLVVLEDPGMGYQRVEVRAKAQVLASQTLLTVAAAG